MKKMKRDAEKEVRALEGKVAAANKQAGGKEKMRKDEELKRRMAVKASITTIVEIFGLSCSSKRRCR